jgi:hypothetical protein
VRQAAVYEGPAAFLRNIRLSDITRVQKTKALLNGVLLLALPTAGIWASPPAHAGDSTCAIPAGFVDVPHPSVSGEQNWVSHVEEVDIDRPLTDVLAAADRPLKDTITASSSLPGVSGDHMLTEGSFGPPGSRRLTCLSEGSTLEEESLVRERTPSGYVFRYVVWNYTSDKAAPIQYGMGEFRYRESADARTHITWTYSFVLKSGRFPGNLVPVGRCLFKWVFLDREYAAMMRGVLAKYRSDAAHVPVHTSLSATHVE